MNTILDILKPKFDVNLSSPITFEPYYILDEGFFKIDFDVKLSNGKNLQRELVWSLEQKQSLIITMLRNVIQLPPLHAIKVDTDEIDCSIMRIIDGKQRLHTIKEYLDNEFTINVGEVDYYYRDLDVKAKNRLRHYNLTFKIYNQYDDNILTDDDLINWFEMVNYSGTPQDINHLKNIKGETSQYIVTTCFDDVADEEYTTTQNAVNDHEALKLHLLTMVDYDNNRLNEEIKFQASSEFPKDINAYITYIRKVVGFTNFICNVEKL